jgi:hypothetical protein
LLKRLLIALRGHTANFIDSPLPAIKDHSTGSLPTDAFGTNLLFENYRFGIINRDTAAFGWPTIAVDTHIFRVFNRTKLAMGKSVELVEQKLIKVMPAEFKIDVHHWLILHGRYTCIARKPRCGSCLIKDLCEFKEKLSD